MRAVLTIPGELKKQVRVKVELELTLEECVALEKDLFDSVEARYATSDEARTLRSHLKYIRENAESVIESLRFEAGNE